MKVARSDRWDLVVGGAAAVIAIAGLGLSVALGNTETIAAGTITGETQRALIVLAGVFLVLVLVKAGIRSRSPRHGLPVESSKLATKAETRLNSKVGARIV